MRCSGIKQNFGQGIRNQDRTSNYLMILGLVLGQPIHSSLRIRGLLIVRLIRSSAVVVVVVVVVSAVSRVVVIVVIVVPSVPAIVVVALVVVQLVVAILLIGVP